MNALRKLRLWHWRKAMEVRRLLNRDRERLNRAAIKGREATFYLHMEFVESLNFYFSDDDTVEKDAKQ